MCLPPLSMPSPAFQWLYTQNLPFNLPTPYCLLLGSKPPYPSEYPFCIIPHELCFLGSKLVCGSAQKVPESKRNPHKTSHVLKSHFQTSLIHKFGDDVLNTETRRHTFKLHRGLQNFGWSQLCLLPLLSILPLLLLVFSLQWGRGLSVRA